MFICVFVDSFCVCDGFCVMLCVLCFVVLRFVCLLGGGVVLFLLLFCGVVLCCFLLCLFSFGLFCLCFFVLSFVMCASQCVCCVFVFLFVVFFEC